MFQFAQLVVSGRMRLKEMRAIQSLKTSYNLVLLASFEITATIQHSSRTAVLLVVNVF